jgi:hypothetical protein
MQVTMGSSYLELDSYVCEECGDVVGLVMQPVHERSCPALTNIRHFPQLHVAYRVPNTYFCEACQELVGAALYSTLHGNCITDSEHAAEQPLPKAS